MELIELIAKMKSRNVELILTDKEQLRFRAPKGAVTELMRVSMKRHREALTDLFLQQHRTEEHTS